MHCEQLLCRTLLLLNGREDECQSARYARVAFHVPPGCASLALEIAQRSEQHAQTPVALFDAEGRVRVMKASDGTVGLAKRQFVLAGDAASEGGLPGPLAAGEWKLILYKRRMLEDVEATVRVTARIADGAPDDMAALARRDAHVEALERAPFSARRLDERAGWYKGELHVHSQESTGKTTVAEIHRAASAQNLDFVAVTDHFTASHWIKLQALGDVGRPLLLQSVEVSGDFGHMNAHGIRRWINPFVDDNEELSRFLGLEERPTMARIADEVHAQGGLVCINHALSGIFGWRYRDFPPEKADLYEVVCLPELTTSFLYATQWDNYLCRGYRLTGVASSDSHHPTQEGPWKLGQAVTWIYAQGLSQSALLDGLKKGRAYVAWGGARLEFAAESRGERAEMGGEIALGAGGRASFRAVLKDHPSGNLFILSDGLIVDVLFYPAAARTEVSFEFAEGDIGRSGQSYVRLEFHEDLVKSQFFGMAYRDHQSIRLLSNPIWLKRRGARRAPNTIPEV